MWLDNLSPRFADCQDNCYTNPIAALNLCFQKQKNKDKNFDRFLDELSKEYTNNSADFFTVFEEKAEEQNLKLPRYFISYGKTKEQIIEQLDLQSTDSINRIIEIIQNRVDQFGVAEPTIQKQGNNRVIVELAGIEDSERARDLLQSTALLELMIVKNVERTNAIIRQMKNFPWRCLYM